MEEEWNVIDAYTRKQALADGFQVEANPATRKEAGIKVPVFFTRTVYDRYVKVPDEECNYPQQEDARLWDVLWMFLYQARKSLGERSFEFKLGVLFPTCKEKCDWQPNEKKSGFGRYHRDVTLYAVIGATDIDDTAPAITIMIPGED